MRFAPHAATRQERMEQSRRDRAAAPVLRATIPTLEQLRIELKFEGTTSSVPPAQSHVLYPPAHAFFKYPCPFWDCDGQFDLGQAVAGAVTDTTHRVEGVFECGGSRVFDRGSRRPCLLRLTYAVTATLQQKK
jgi:hypothetical protein